MVYAVILAGGTGTRFWPFSRELEPKQFMRVTGGLSLLQATIKRLGKVAPMRNTYIITNQAYFFEVKKQVERFSISQENIILEPEGKNTAPAIGLAARLIQQKDKDAVLVVLPSDHYVTGEPGFRQCLKNGISCAKKDFLVTIGIKPRSASTGYGYIKVSPRFKGYFEVEKFLEKPSLAKAKKYVRDKSFYWNSGIFIWKAKVFLKELNCCLPQLYSQLSAINSKEDIAGIWPRIKPVSADYGVMEHAKKIALIPAKFYWTDLGSWDALNEVLPRDKSGNVIQADVMDLGSRGVSIFSRSPRLICSIGLEDLIIADTPDALLVCHREKAQEVRKIVQNLKNLKRKEHIAHTTEKRPWGHFTVLQTGTGFKIKLIEIDSHKRLSLQRHSSRAEHWVVISGCAKVTSGKTVSLVETNRSIFVARGTKHRLENPKDTPLKIVEVQTGQYLQEDDIERFSDDYQR